MEYDETRHIFKNDNDFRWKDNVFLAQCENVNELYIIDYYSFSFHDSSKLCESVGLQMIKKFDFEMIPGT